MTLTKLEKKKVKIIKEGNKVLNLAIKYSEIGNKYFKKLEPIMQKRFKIEDQIKQLKKKNNGT